MACAVAIQKGVAERAGRSPARAPIVFRIGDQPRRRGRRGRRPLGDGVNVAARLEQLCEPGGVLVSGTAYDHLQGKLDLPLEFAGEQQVKNIERPVRAYRVRLDGARCRGALAFRSVPRRLARRGRRRPAARAGAAPWAGGSGLPSRPSPASRRIAVLPFDNLGGDEATGRLADGITEDIITDLARFPRVRRDRPQLDRGLQGQARRRAPGRQGPGVRYVLEGSIQRQGDQVRVTAQLIDAKTGTHVWSERWDRPAEDVFAVQTEIAEQVANRLGSGAGLIQEAERKAAKRKRPENLGAYELYLLGTERLEQSPRTASTRRSGC